MSYLKCIFAGLCFLVVSAILLVLGTIAFFAIFVHAPKGQSIGFDPVSIVKSFPILWILAVLFFSLGFMWEYMRVASS